MKRDGESSKGYNLHCTSFRGVGLGVGGDNVLSTTVLCDGSLKLAAGREREPSLDTFQKNYLLDCEAVSALNLGVPLDGPA